MNEVSCDGYLHLKWVVSPKTLILEKGGEMWNLKIIFIIYNGDELKHVKLLWNTTTYKGFQDV